MDFKNLNFNTNILKAIEEMGYLTPTPIQKEAIPKVMQKQDLIASAQTGTGKTAAFILPVLNNFLNGTETETKKRKGPKLLVVVPTRELAIQMTSDIKKFSKYLPEIKTVCVVGGVAFFIQNKDLSKRYDILVATPGRLLDHMGRGRIDLSELEVLIVDEADRMLDMGFVEDVRQIADACSTERQTLMFSATLDKNILALSRELQKDPSQLIIAASAETALKIEQRLYYTDDIGHKMRLLEHFLNGPEVGQAIVFTATKSLAEELANKLIDAGLNAAALHSDIHQRQRTRTFEKLRSGKIQILVATDVAARGIDIVNLSYVINFDIPRQAEDYVHRIGRTGRAGASGIALSFTTRHDVHLIGDIERLTKQPMPYHTVEGMEPTKPMPRGREEKDKKSSSGRGFGDRKFKGSRSRRSFSDRDSRPRKSFDDSRPRKPFSDDESKPRRSFSDRDSRPRRSFSDKPRRPFADDESGPRKPFSDDESKPRRSFSDDESKPRRSFSDRDSRPRKPFDDSRPRKPFDDSRPRRSFSDKPRRPFSDDDSRPRKPFSDDESKPKRSFSDRDSRPRKPFDDSRPRRPFSRDDSKIGRFPFKKSNGPKRTFKED